MGSLETTRRSYNLLAQDYYDRRQDRSVLDPLIDHFLEQLAAGDRVLDVGCGPGFESNTLRQRGLHVVSFDLSLSMLRVAGKSFKGPVTLGDMRCLPFNRAFDAIWSCASLLHLSRSEVPAALNSFRDSLNDDGVLFVAVKRGEGEETHSRPFGQPRFFTYWQDEPFDKLLIEAGFRIETTGPYSDPEHPWLHRIARKVQAFAGQKAQISAS